MYKQTVTRLMEEHSLDCYLTFTSDCHLNEYIGEQDRRLAQLTGFTGSNGIGLTCSSSVLITDSRYYIQAAAESNYPLFKGTVAEHAAKHGYRRVGLDLRLISTASYTKLSRDLKKEGAEIVGITETEDIERPLHKLTYLEDIMLDDFLHYSPGSRDGENRIITYLESLGFTKFYGNVCGSCYKEKLARIRAVIGNRMLIVAELDTIAWILNIRGSDIAYNPVFYAYMTVTKDTATLYTDHQIILDGVKLRSYSAFEGSLDKAQTVLVSGDCNQYIAGIFSDMEKTEEIRAMQASKNNNEMVGMALSYVYDGIALTNLCGYLAKAQDYTEKDVALRLEEYKRVFPWYCGPSFETISGSGTNGAIVHHSSTDRLVDKRLGYLIDSGSHYYFGTTDTTRTLIPSGIYEGSNDGDGFDIASFIHDNTLVFRGHIGAMMKEYESGPTCASAIDALARCYLKAEDKDFGHATGHGVGHYLCVHEHPPVISSKYAKPIAPNQVFSIEPGYYREGHYGIRVESLVYSREENGRISLVNITVVPYQLGSLDLTMLTVEEKEYLNAFNKTVRWLLEEYVTEDGLKFLLENTKLIC